MVAILSFIKAHVVASIVAAIIIVVGVTSIVVINSQPKSVIGDFSVAFSGYNAEGTASASWTNSSDESKYGNLVREVVSPNENLTNGESVSLTIYADDNSGVKSESKTFTVSGLKSMTKYTVNDVLKSSPVTFIGWTGYGTEKFDDSVWSSTDSSSSDSSAPANLANGQSVSVQLSSSYIAQQKQNGYVLDGSGQTDVKVSGLLDPKTAFKNLDAVTSAVSDHLNLHDTSDSYTFDKVYFYVPNNASPGDFSLIFQYDYVLGYLKDTDAYRVDYKSSDLNTDGTLSLSQTVNNIGIPNYTQTTGSSTSLFPTNLPPLIQIK